MVTRQSRTGNHVKDAASRIAIILGHPDAGAGHFCHALARAYGGGAEAAGHAVRTIAVGELNFPLLRSKHDFDKGEPLPCILEAQEIIRWASHLVIIYPLWLGTMPALLKGFLEQVFRPGFAMQPPKSGHVWEKMLKGRSARIVITMGMPAPVYRWYFGAHSLKIVKRNILGFAGIGPIRSSLIGLVEASGEKRERWLERMHALGRGAR